MSRIRCRAMHAFFTCMVLMCSVGVLPQESRADDVAERAVDQTTIRAQVVDEDDRPAAEAQARLVAFAALDEGKYGAVTLATAVVPAGGRLLVEIAQEKLTERQLSQARLIVEDEQDRFGWANVEKLDALLQQPSADADADAVDSSGREISLESPIRLVKTQNARVRFVDGAGRPLQDLSVKPLNFAEGDFAKYYELTTTNFYVPSVSLPDEMVSKRSTKTDSDGSCVLQRIPKGFVCVAEVVQGSSSYRLSVDPTKDVTVTLDPGGALTGSVASEDEEFDPASIRVSAILKQTPTAESPSYLIQHSADAEIQGDGSFTLAKLLPGTYTLTASSSDERFFPGTIGTQSVSTEGNSDPIEFSVKRGVLLEGRVVDARTGEGVADVWVNLSLAQAGSSGTRWSGGSRTDSEGRFRSYVPAGQIRSHVWNYPRAYSSAEIEQATIDLAAGSERQTLADIRLIRAAEVVGTVVDADGRPVPSAEIIGHSPEHRDPTAISDEQGRFRITRLDPDDTHPLRAIAGDAVTDGAVVIDAAKLEGPIKLVVKPENAFRVTGRLVDSKRNPIADTAVQVLWSRSYVSRKTRLAGTSSTYKTLTTDADGRFQSPSLWPHDRYRIRIVADKFSGYDSPEVAGLPGQMHSFGTIPLLSTSNSVSGRVVDSSGTPLEGVVVFNSGDGAKRASTRTSADGQFSLEGLREGAVWILARHEGFHFAGLPTESNETDVILTLYRDDENPPQDGVVAPLTYDKRKQLAKHFLTELYSLPMQQRGPVNFLILRYMAMIDPPLAMKWAGNPENAGRRNDVMMQIAQTILDSDPDEALALVGQVSTGGYFYRVLGMAEQVRETNPELALQLAEDLVLRCRKVDPPNRIYQIAQTGRLLMRLGQEESGGQLLNEAFEEANRLGGAGREPFVRGFTAEQIAEFDYTKARQLIDGMPATTGTSQVRHLGNAAVNVAQSNPDTAVAMAKALGSRVAVRVAYQLAGSDPERARKLIDNLQGRGAARYQAEGLKWLAVAIHDENPSLAHLLIDQSLELCMTSSRDFDSWSNYGFEAVPAAHAVATARILDYPDIAGATMRALSCRRTPSQRNTEVECLRSTLKTAKFLALADRNTSRRLLEQLADRTELLGGGGYTSIPRDDWLISWCLTDPERAKQVFTETLKRDMGNNKRLEQKDAMRVLGWLVLPDDDLHRQLCRDDALWYPGEE